MNHPLMVAMTAALLIPGMVTAWADCDTCTEPLVPVTVAGGNMHLLITNETGPHLTRGLTVDECEFMKARALGLPATAEEKATEQRKTEERWERSRIEQEARDSEALIACEFRRDGDYDTGGVWPSRIACKNGAPVVPMFSILSSGMTVSYTGVTRQAECFK